MQRPPDPRTLQPEHITPPVSRPGPPPRQQAPSARPRGSWRSAAGSRGGGYPAWWMLGKTINQPCNSKATCYPSFKIEIAETNVSILEPPKIVGANNRTCASLLIEPRLRSNFRQLPCRSHLSICSLRYARWSWLIETGQ